MKIILAIALTSHLGLDGDYNEAHPHIQARFDSGFVAGAYVNSEGNGSAYLGRRYEWDAAFLEVGGVTGYTNAPLLPYARAGYAITDNVDVFIAPAAEWGKADNFGAVVGISLSFTP